MLLFEIMFGCILFSEELVTCDSLFPSLGQTPLSRLELKSSQKRMAQTVMGGLLGNLKAGL